MITHMFLSPCFYFPSDLESYKVQRFSSAYHYQGQKMHIHGILYCKIWENHFYKKMEIRESFLWKNHGKLAHWANISP